MSRVTLEALLEQSWCSLSGMLFPMPPGGDIPVSPQTGHLPVSRLAHSKGIPSGFVQTDARQWLERGAPDLLLISCYPHRLPEYVYANMSIPCLNLHPSLLPRYRGPDPLFWQFQRGETKTGFSWHQVTDTLDQGPVLQQGQVCFPTGCSQQEAETRLITQAVISLGECLAESEYLKFSEQNPEHSSYQSWPTAADWIVDSEWSAMRARNFVMAMSGRYDRFGVRSGSEFVTFREIGDWHATGSIEQATIKQGTSTWCRFNPGYLELIE